MGLFDWFRKKKKEDTAPVAEPAPAEEPAPAPAEAGPRVVGKYEFDLSEAGYHFYLLANNGQVLYTGKTYQKLCQCLEGIKSFKRAVYVANFTIDCDKFGHYRYILRNVGVAPAFVGESYATRSQCESSVESVKRFVVSAKIELPEGATDAQ